MLHVGEAVESWPMGRDRCTLCIYFRKRLCWGLESSDTYCLGGARQLWHPTPPVLAQRRRLFVQAGT